VTQKKMVTLAEVERRLIDISLNLLDTEGRGSVDHLLADIRETLAAQQAKHDVWKSAKRTLAVDFDGVIHSYKQPWKGPAVIPDPPIPGAIEWLRAASERFQIMIFSARCNSDEGITAMINWLRSWGVPDAVLKEFIFEPGKPSAFAFIDDRAIQFLGDFTELPVTDLGKFKPWYYANPEWRKNRE